MIARALPADPPHSHWPGCILFSLIAVHFAATAFVAQAVVSLLGLQEFQVVAPVAAGLAWGQAVLLGQFLLLGDRRPALRIMLAVGWFGLADYLGGPAFNALFPPGALGSCLFLGLPFSFSAAIAMGRRARGCRISRSRENHYETFQFSLRHLLLLTLLVAVALATVRFARETVEETSDVILLFGLWAPISVFLILPLFGPWAALSAGHPGFKCSALILFCFISAAGPAFVGKAKALTYWMLICPFALPSLAVVGSLLIARLAGYRYMIVKSAAPGKVFIASPRWH